MVTVRPTDDAGFSLTELIIVMVLLGVVLSISYGALYAVFRSNDVALRHAAFSSEVAAPLHVIEKVLTQATYVEEAAPYRITVLTDRDNDNSVERHVIEALADGTLRHRTWATNSMRQNTTLIFDAQWSENNTNQQRVLPLIYYYGDVDDNGIVELLSTPVDPADVSYVDVNISVEFDDVPYQDTRSAWMRNRS